MQINKSSTADHALTVVLAFTPLLIYWFIKEFIVPRPFWVYYDHIESLYYYTSIELLEGITPHNLDNPGSIVQLAGVAVLALVGTSPQHYPQFVAVSHIFIVMLSFASTFVLVKYAMRSLPRSLAVSSIWTYFSFAVSLMYFHVWSPEAFYYIVGILGITSLLWLSGHPDRLRCMPVLIFGATIGAAISVKFTFLAWLPAMGVVLFLAAYSKNIGQDEPIIECFKRGLAYSLLGFVGAIISFLLITFPMREGYSYMFSWILQNAMNDGAYGRGEIAAPVLSQAIENWTAFIMGGKGWLLLVGGALLVVCWKALRGLPREGVARRKVLLVISFGVTAGIFSLLFVMRSYASRYMLPIGLVGVAVFVVFSCSIASSNKWIKYAVVIATGLLLLKTIDHDFNTHLAKIEQAEKLRKSGEMRVAALASNSGIVHPVVVYGWRFPTPSFALRQHARLEEHQLAVDKIFANEGHYTPWPKGDTFRAPGGNADWDFAIIRNEYIDQLTSLQFEEVDSFDVYRIIRRLDSREK